MTRETAWTKVADKLKVVLTTAVESDPDRTLHVFTSQDRTDAQPLEHGEIPGVIIRIAKVEYDFAEMAAQMRHSGQVIFSCQSGSDEALSIDPANQDVMAFIVETLAASDDLDGMVEDIVPATSDASEQAAPDVGEALLIFDCILYTPTGDFRTIIGRSGDTF